MIAVSLGDSTVQILSADYKKLVNKFKMKPSDQNFDLKGLYPVTSLSWLPTKSADIKDWKLLGSCLDGSIIHWNPSMKNKAQQVLLNKDNSYRSIDFNREGSQFAVSGSLPIIEIYDSLTFRQVSQIESAHDSSVMTQRFYPSDSNMMFSGGNDG